MLYAFGGVSTTSLTEIQNTRFQQRKRQITTSWHNNKQFKKYMYSSFNRISKYIDKSNRT